MRIDFGDLLNRTENVTSQAHTYIVYICKTNQYTNFKLIL